MADRVALVTGATSGLGQAMALELARRDWTILVHGRDAAKCVELVGRARNMGAHCRAYVGDFRSLRDVQRMCGDVERHESQIDLIINNAATGFDRGLSTTTDGYDETIQINLISPYIIVKRLHRVMIGRERPIIVNMASAGQSPFRRPVDFRAQKKLGYSYGQSKLGLIGAAKALAPMLGEKGILTLCITPGSLLDTALTARLLSLSPGILRRLLTRRASRAPALHIVAAMVLDHALASGDRGADYIDLSGTGKIHSQIRSRDFLTELSGALERAAEPFLD